MAEERSWFPLIAIVAIVAIVGLVVLVVGGKAGSVPTKVASVESEALVYEGEESDFAGEVFSTGVSNRRTYCPAVYDPVCGVNGRTYTNDCYAENLGVEVACEGPCPCPPQLNCMWIRNDDSGLTNEEKCKREGFNRCLYSKTNFMYTFYDNSAPNCDGKVQAYWTPDGDNAGSVVRDSCKQKGFSPGSTCQYTEKDLYQRGDAAEPLKGYYKMEGGNLALCCDIS